MKNTLYALLAIFAITLVACNTEPPTDKEFIEDAVGEELAITPYNAQSFADVIDGDSDDDKEALFDKFKNTPYKIVATAAKDGSESEVLFLYYEPGLTQEPKFKIGDRLVRVKGLPDSLENLVALYKRCYLHDDTSAYAFYNTKKRQPINHEAWLAEYVYGLKSGNDVSSYEYDHPNETSAIKAGKIKWNEITVEEFKDLKDDLDANPYKLLKYFIIDVNGNSKGQAKFAGVVGVRSLVDVNDFFNHSYKELEGRKPAGVNPQSLVGVYSGSLNLTVQRVTPDGTLEGYYYDDGSEFVFSGKVNGNVLMIQGKDSETETVLTELNLKCQGNKLSGTHKFISSGYSANVELTKVDKSSSDNLSATGLGKSGYPNGIEDDISKITREAEQDMARAAREVEQDMARASRALESDMAD